MNGNPNAFRRLTELEFSRYRAGVPGWSRRGMSIGAAYALLLLALGLFVFRNVDSPYLVLAAAMLGWLEMALGTALLGVLTDWANPMRQWWLTFPYPRATLLYAKGLSLARFGLRFAAVFLPAALVCYGFRTDTGEMEALAAGDLAAAVASYVLFGAAALPLAIALGLFVMTLFKGWARWGIIPYIFVVQAPIILAGMVLDPDEVLPAWVLAPDAVSLGALVMAVVGWPTAYLLLRVAARYGLRRLPDAVANTRPAFLSAPAPESTAATPTYSPRGHGYRAAYALDRSFYRHYGSRLIARLIVRTMLLLVAVGSFFSVGEGNAGIFVSQFSFMLIAMFGNIWGMSLIGHEVQKKRLAWWLGFPYARVRLLFTRVAALWTTVMRYMLATAAAYGLGTAAGMLTRSVEQTTMRLQLEWALFAFLIYAGLFTVMIGLLQAAHYFMQSTRLSIVITPIYLLVIFGPQLVNRYLFPSTEEAAVTVGPDWRFLWLLLAIGLPLAALCIRFGAAHVHQILRQQSSPRMVRNTR